MTPSEIARKIEMLTAESEYSRRTADILSQFEELHRQASRDTRLDPETRTVHGELVRAMSEEISDVLKIAEQMDQARRDLIAAVRAVTVGELVADADLCGHREVACA